VELSIVDSVKSLFTLKMKFILHILHPLSTVTSTFCMPLFIPLLVVSFQVLHDYCSIYY